MNIKKRLIIFVLLLFFIAGSGAFAAQITTTDVACSGINTITINQVYVPGGNNEGYIELYVNSNQNILNWDIYYENTPLNVNNTGIVYRNGVALTGAANPMPDVQAGDYIIFNENDFGGNNNAFGQSDGEVLLVDGSDAAVHYLRYFNNNNSWYWNVPASCSTSYDQGNSSEDGVCSMPDGSLDEGDWVTCDDSKGETNDPSTSCSLGSFTVTQENFALACPETRALVSIVPYCSDGVTVKSDYAGTVNLNSDSTGSQFYSGNTGGSSINSVTFAAGSGTASVYLYNNQEQVVHVTVTDIAPDPDISATGNGTDFRAYGFRADIAQSSLICGNSNIVTVTAYGKTNNSAGASCEIITGFSGSKDLKVWLAPYYIDSATTVGSNTNITLNTIVLPDAEPGSTNVSNINFTNGQASLDVLWNDAGRVNLHVKHDNYPYDGVPGANYNAEHRAPLQDDTGIITLRAEDFEVLVTLTDDITVLNNIDPLTTSPVLKAGSEMFNVIVTAKCVNDVTAANFASVVELSTDAPDFSFTGNLGPVANPSEVMVSGIASFNNLTYDEVGHFTLKADTTETYLDTGIIISGSYITGRFVPDHFYLDSYSMAPEAAWLCDFSYLGQPNIDINYTIQALTGDVIPTVAQNYNYTLTSNHAKSVFSHVLEDDNNGTAPLISRFTPLLSYAVNGWVNGEYPVSALYAFQRDVLPDGVFEPLRLGMKLTDDAETAVDIELSNTLDMNAVTADDCSVSGNCDALEIGSINLKYGRLNIANAYGPNELALLNVSIYAEYYDAAAANFLLNGDDSCTLNNKSETIDWLAAIYSGDLSTVKNIKSTNKSDIDKDGITDSTMISGLNTFHIHDSADPLDVYTGPDQNGYVDYVFPTETWLLYDWDNTAVDSAPLRRASFGLYNRSKRLIYTREVY